jgi:hypothetical protein
MGYQWVLDDAQKLIDDAPTDPRDRLRGLLVYGFRNPVSQPDQFPEKYQTLGRELGRMGFAEAGISSRTLDGVQYAYVQVGLWALGLT